MKPLLDKTIWAFAELNCPMPEQEAYLLSQSIDTILIAVLRDGVKAQENYKQF